MNKKRNGVKSPKMVLFILYKFQSSTDKNKYFKMREFFEGSNVVYTSAPKKAK